MKPLVSYRLRLEHGAYAWLAVGAGSLLAALPFRGPPTDFLACAGGFSLAIVLVPLLRLPEIRRAVERARPLPPGDVVQRETVRPPRRLVDASMLAFFLVLYDLVVPLDAGPALAGWAGVLLGIGATDLGMAAWVARWERDHEMGLLEEIERRLARSWKDDPLLFKRPLGERGAG